MGYEGVDLIYVSQDKDHLRNLLKSLTSLQIPRTLWHGVYEGIIASKKDSVA
jgi:hypothetical protein